MAKARRNARGMIFYRQGETVFISSAPPRQKCGRSRRCGALRAKALEAHGPASFLSDQGRQIFIKFWRSHCTDFLRAAQRTRPASRAAVPISARGVSGSIIPRSAPPVPLGIRFL